MTGEDPIVDLASAVADGKPIDWSSAERSAASHDDLDALRQLRAIEQIACHHRRFSKPAPPPRP